MTDQPGQVLAGKYRLVGLAGQGGMAVVWRALARDPQGGVRTVAIKRLLPEYVRSEQYRAMFVEEARVGLQLRHPNIVSILDFGQDEHGQHYLAMEWVEGVDLLRLLELYRNAGRKIPWPFLVEIGAQVASGLGSAHERTDSAGRPMPIFHRDVSPQNILLSVEGGVKLSDFGLARAMDREAMTNPNIVKGKLSYLAPELITGKPASAQSDIFGAGVVLWEALAGRKLFEGKTDLEVLLGVKDANIPHLSTLRPELPPSLAKVIHTALAKDPAERFASARQMARALGNVLALANQRVSAASIGRLVEEGRAQIAAPAA